MDTLYASIRFIWKPQTLSITGNGLIHRPYANNANRRPKNIVKKIYL